MKNFNEFINENISHSKIKQALIDIDNAPSARMKLYWDEESTQEISLDDGLTFVEYYPQKGKPNSIITKNRKKGVVDKFTRYKMNPDIEWKYLQNKNYGDKSKEYEVLDILGYDDNGDICAVLSIVTKENSNTPLGAFKIITRPDEQRKGWSFKLLDKAENEGIDILGSIKNNHFSSQGRLAVKKWLEKKLSGI
jgi:hypothetical protein